MKIDNIHDNSIIFASDQDKLEILNHLSGNSLFLKLAFFDYKQSYCEIDKKYYFYLKENYQFSLDFSQKIKKYFDYIDINSEYTSTKLNELRGIKLDLINNSIIRPFNFAKYLNKTIYSLNGMPVSPLFNAKKIELITSHQDSKEKVNLYKSGNLVESIHSVYETAVRLLESGIDISKITILNSSAEDDYYLNKYFSDSNIPISINKPYQINQHPKIIGLLREIQNNGYIKSKIYLETMISDNSISDICKAVVNIYNKYLDFDFENHPDILFQLINKTTTKPKKYTNCINVDSIDSFIYDEDSYYLVMNYTDESLPKSVKEIGYLNSSELAELKYYSNEEENEYLKQHYQRILRQIKHLFLFYSSVSQEENRISDLNLAREIDVIEYMYLTKEYSYFNTLNQLDFAKEKYDYKTYYIQKPDYTILYNSFNNLVNLYTHDFTKITQSSLNYLLSKYNTITGAKIESYNLCEFQYLLKYLLKLEDMEPSTNQYLGTLSHKVLEEVTNDETVDVDRIIDEFKGFPEIEGYKEAIYKKAVKQEVIHLVTIVKEFHNKTKFNKIDSEIKFKIPFDEANEFYLTGIIDKVMSFVDENKIRYFALIDYKLSEKDFKMKDFLKGKQMQLPMYLYAYMNMNDGDLSPIGIYYQTTALGRYKSDSQAILDNYKLKGISVLDANILKSFDPDGVNLKSIRYKNDGSLQSSKTRLYPKSELNNIYINVKKSIKTMIEKLRNGEFSINPIRVEGAKADSVSCEYCKFASICYKKNTTSGGDF
ncbi:PD-(D/E)XK nuclease family protein [Mycoplasmatota bacterium WC30]